MFNVAMLQMYAVRNDLHGNMKKAENFCRRAKELGSHIAVMPEEWSNGCSMDDPDRPDSLRECMESAVSDDGEFVTHFRDLGRELDMAIALTYLQAWDPTPRNVLTIVDRHGKIAMTYAKVHTCPFLKSEAILTPGRTFDVCTLDIGEESVRVGAQICYDFQFPETTRCLMLGGAEVVVAATGFAMNDLSKNHVQVRSYENAVGFAMAAYPGPTSYGIPMARSKTGTILYYPTNGQSIAYGPQGNLLAVGGTGEEVVVASFDLDALREFRGKSIQGNAFRRPHCYSQLTDEAIRAPFDRIHAFGERFQPAEAPSASLV